MRLDNLFTIEGFHQDSKTILEEGVRFGSRELQKVDKNGNDIMVGIEYEFHVDNDGLASEDNSLARLDRILDGYADEVAGFVEDNIKVYDPVVRLDRQTSNIIRNRVTHYQAGDYKNIQQKEDKASFINNTVVPSFSPFTELFSKIQFSERDTLSFTVDAVDSENPEDRIFYAELEDIVDDIVDDVDELIDNDMEYDYQRVRNKLNRSYDHVIGLETKTDDNALLFIEENFEELYSTFLDVLAFIDEYFDIDSGLIKNKNESKILDLFGSLPDSGNAPITIHSAVYNSLKARYRDYLENVHITVSANAFVTHAWDVINDISDTPDRNSRSDIIRDMMNDASIPIYAVHEEHDDQIEAVTDAEPLPNALRSMKAMFDIIRTVGHTSDSSGMHVNISYRNQGRYFNPFKLALLMDTDFMEENYHIRNEYVNKLKLEENMYDILRAISSEGSFSQQEVVDIYADRVSNRLDTKYYQFNFRGNRNDFRDGYVEFRFFGGDEYEHEYEKHEYHIKRAAYHYLAAVDPDFGRREYYTLAYKLIDSVIEKKTGFSLSFIASQLQDAVRRGEVDIRDWVAVAEYLRGMNANQRKRQQRQAMIGSR